MSKPPRNIELGKIHMAAKKLGLKDDVYRDMLWNVADVRSSKDLDEQGRKKVLDHLKKCGAVFKSNKRIKPTVGKKALISKVRAFMAEAKRPDSYADGMARRMFNVDCYEWLDAGQLHKLVAALAYDATRNGRRVK